MGFWQDLTSKGIKFPYAHDPVTDRASITLLFPYVTFIVAIMSTIYLIVRDVFIGTVTAIVFWGLATVFYLLRSLHKAKIDLDDKSLELESNEKEGGSDDTN